MIKFREKIYTLQEGHYTGPKDQDKVPGALEVIGKSALGGALAGTAIGAIMKNSNAFSGAIEGGKWGALGGVVFKLFLNYLHNPMSTVKFQNVDKLIRREFGILRVAGVTVGDTIDKRANVDEKFSFNDRRITDYKLNFSIQDNQVTMYTLEITDKDLEKINKILDYYCKKYFGMEYSSTVINKKLNSYSATIVFTNYQVISNFIMELSKELGYKINIMDNKALALSRMQYEDDEEEERTYSIKRLNTLDIPDILKGGFKPVKYVKTWKESVGYGIIEMILTAVKKLGRQDATMLGLNLESKDYGNPYLESVLKKLHYIEGFNYTTGRKDVKTCMSLISGLFVVTAEKDSPEMKKIDDIFWKAKKSEIIRTDTGKAILYTYRLTSKSEFEFLVKKLMSTEIIINIFD